MKQTKKIALGGVTAALALTTLLIGGLLGVGTYAAPVLAAIALLPAGNLLGKKLVLNPLHLKSVVLMLMVGSNLNRVCIA